jgi:hypothetical protein
LLPFGGNFVAKVSAVEGSAYGKRSFFSSETAASCCSWVPEPPDRGLPRHHGRRGSGQARQASPPHVGQRRLAQKRRLDWHHIKPVYLSAYSQDFNPIERLWQHLKGRAMAGFLTAVGEALTTKLLESLQSLLEEPKLIRSVCATLSFIRK